MVKSEALACLSFHTVSWWLQHWELWVTIWLSWWSLNLCSKLTAQVQTQRRAWLERTNPWELSTQSTHRIHKENPAWILCFLWMIWLVFQGRVSLCYSAGCPGSHSVSNREIRLPLPLECWRLKCVSWLPSWSIVLRNVRNLLCCWNANCIVIRRSLLPGHLHSGLCSVVSFSIFLFVSALVSWVAFTRGYPNISANWWLFFLPSILLLHVCPSE